MLRVCRAYGSNLRLQCQGAEIKIHGGSIYRTVEVESECLPVALVDYGDDPSVAGWTCFCGTQS